MVSKGVNNMKKKTCILLVLVIFCCLSAFFVLAESWQYALDQSYEYMAKLDEQTIVLSDYYGRTIRLSITDGTVTVLQEKLARHFPRFFPCRELFAEYPAAPPTSSPLSASARRFIWMTILIC